jgi:hypothetical protein
MTPDTINYVAAEAATPRSRRRRRLTSRVSPSSWRPSREKGIELVGPSGLLSQLTSGCCRPRWRPR